ncbi:hypothetical protein NDU88_003245, partial [Pleurodeles waltl]
CFPIALRTNLKSVELFHLPNQKHAVASHSIQTYVFFLVTLWDNSTAHRLRYCRQHHIEQQPGTNIHNWKHTTKVTQEQQPRKEIARQKYTQQNQLFGFNADNNDGKTMYKAIGQ